MQKLLKVTSLFFLLFGMTHPVHAKIISEVVDYQIEGQAFQGYISYDNKISAKRPAIIVVHEWWGHNAYARKRADMLAKMGYTAFAIDMYGKDKLAKHPDDALKFMQAVSVGSKIAENRFKHALNLLKNHAMVDSNKIAAIGYCFGGGTVLNMAKNPSELLGVVSFHGSLSSTTPTQTNQTKVLVLNGADDPFVTAEQISSFKQSMETAKIDYEFVNYPGVKHSFTNPEANNYGKQFDIPLVYDAVADKDSWQRMQQFFKKIFASPTINN